ncbi:DUF4440 domain-containing protein [Fictibacillus sp. KIGAM418]|uniref:DUF4440 domain-containing protein n=1 Tax=Fictibacillus marinisediminis TaxID=2878389 RepID=A0A9X2BCE2_9BACL|nr:DUF4440 domain-containing protein [Fictibacillus marinisediminis]MCK6256361.1 DUF4440 domain-containing protein [Fictibacillus marinisediminis]
MDDVLKELIYELETRLLQSEVRQSKKELDVLLADDFLEFTSSGRRISKQDCFDGLGVPIMTVSHFEIQLLSDKVVQAIYELNDETNNLKSLRSSLWRENNGVWQMFFHQGTLK